MTTCHLRRSILRPITPAQGRVRMSEDRDAEWRPDSALRVTYPRTLNYDSRTVSRTIRSRPRRVRARCGSGHGSPAEQAPQSGRPCVHARDQGSASSGDRGSKASTHGVGQGESRHGLRHGAVPAGHLAEAQYRAAFRDHGGRRPLEGVRQRHQRGKWAPHVSTWGALGELVGIGVNATAPLTRPVR